MTAGWAEQSPLFKRAVVISSVLHVVLFIFVVSAPRLPVRQKKGLVQYVSFLGFPGGGGSGGSGSGGPGGAAVQASPPAAAKKESLRDLTIASKVKPAEPPASMRYPVEKPKRDKSAPPEKKAAITRPDIGLKPPGEETSGDVPAASQGASGVRIGLGEGGGGGGSGGGFGGSGGLANFPYAWYVQVIMNRVSANWFTSLVDPGVAGTYQTVIYFRIHRDGSISDLKVETSSGIASLDVSAQRAVQSAVPFPPLPSAYEDQFLGIHLIFEHSK